MKTSFGPTPKYPLVLNYKNKQSKIPIIIGGPCAVEDPDKIRDIYSAIANNVSHFRGGVFRAGTYPGEQFGLNLELLQEMHKAANFYSKPNVVDILDIRDLNKIDPYVDVYQVGMRQAQHYALLTELGRQKKPVILKRGSWMTLEELFGAAEYILKGGNENVILCERGGVSYLNHCRWELSISLIAKTKQVTSLPIIIDASHGTGAASLVAPMTLAGIAAGADGFISECHYNPLSSISDSEQAISLQSFMGLCMRVNNLRMNI